MVGDTQATSGDPVVVGALAAGWAMAELYDMIPSLAQKPHPPDERWAASTRAAKEKGRPEPVRHLEGASKLDPRLDAAAGLTTVQLALAAVADGRSGAWTPPDTADVRAAAHLGTPRHTVQVAVEKYHEQVIAYLAGVHPRAAKAYGLGRMLADTVLLPSHDPIVQFGKSLNAGRLDNARAWLSDLETDLPTGAAEAVRYGLEQWQLWNLAQPTRTADTEKEVKTQTVALARQGRLWRQLLTGGTPVDSLLMPDSYVQAARHSLTSAVRIVRGFVRDAWLPIVMAMLLLAGLITLALLVPTVTAKAVLSVGAALSAVGLTWKGVGTTLGSTLEKAQTMLWKLEVANARNQAALILPAAPQPRPSKAALGP